MTNINDTWTDADYDKYFDEMNLGGRERAVRKDKGSKRDWYARKVSAEVQKTLDEICNSQRFSARETRRGNSERRWSKEVQFNRKINDWIKKCANYLMQGDFGIFCDAFAGTIVFFDGERESMYVKANHTTHDQEDSIYAGLEEAMRKADYFTQKIIFKGKNDMLKAYRPPEVMWVFREDAPPGPGIGDAELGPYQLDLTAGGFCTRGSYRKVDCVNALILRNEFVLSRRAVRGLGKGSYELGAKILYQLMAQWEREANKYAQRR